LRMYIGFESNSVLACAKGEIAALIVAVIEIPLYSACLVMTLHEETTKKLHVFVHLRRSDCFPSRKFHMNA
jgi:hypothetical protein